MSFTVIITTSGSATTLCASPSPMQVTGLQPGVAGLIQDQPLYDSLSRFLAYRGNELFTETLNVLRNTDDSGNVFTDGFAAGAWARGHIKNCPRSGRIDLIYVSGATTTNYYFTNGILLPIKVTRQIGKLLTLSYTIQGSPLLLA